MTVFSKGVNDTDIFFRSIHYFIANVNNLAHDVPGRQFTRVVYPCRYDPALNPDMTFAIRSGRI